MPTSDRFEAALQEITHRFAMEVVELVRTTTVQELTSLAQPAGEALAPTTPPKKPAMLRGRPPKPSIEATAAEATEKPVKRPGRPPKAKKKRNWPNCSVEGCAKKMYPGSGKSRLCYGHHLDAGGKTSPLVLMREQKAM